ncbi:MAG: DUF3050 domain-containing protein [Bacteroidota bacterium]
MERIAKIEATIAPLRTQLVSHALYNQLQDIDDVKTFMEKHVYAVWDFMSLLKALQLHLTGMTLPWRPVKNPKLARFINEIVLDEESDLNEAGETQSHFEIYLDAMKEVGAATAPVLNLLSEVSNLDDFTRFLSHSNLLEEVEREFLRYTFSLVQEGAIHKIAAAFTFGREDILPDVFLGVLESAGAAKFPKLIYYLQRHIELDGDEHGPLSIEMIKELCGEDEQKWSEVELVAKQALLHRIRLWDKIVTLIAAQKSQLQTC